MMTRDLHKDVSEILLSANDIQDRIMQLGTDISRDYDGKELSIVVVLRGAFMFFADLLRHIKTTSSCDFIAINSYGSDTKSSGVVRILKDLEDSVQSKHVLIVEDIVDTGLTLNYIMKVIRGRNPASVRVCSLLDKPERRKVDAEIDYLGFTIPDKFVIGYGLDYDQRYRHLPYVGVLRPEIYTGS